MRDSLFIIAACVLVAAVSSCTGRKGQGPVADGPAFRISIDSTTALNGQSVTISLRQSLTGLGRPPDSIGSFDIVVAYDDSVLEFLGVDEGEGISTWEYFTWRAPAKSEMGTIRVASSRDLENASTPDSSQRLPIGELARLTFGVTSNRDFIGHESEITFWCSECFDNILVDPADWDRLHIAESILSNSALSQTPDTLDCPRRYTLVPDIEFVSGAIRMLEPPDDRDTINIGGP